MPFHSIVNMGLMTNFFFWLLCSLAHRCQHNGFDMLTNLFSSSSVCRIDRPAKSPGLFLLFFIFLLFVLPSPATYYIPRCLDDSTWFFGSLVSVILVVLPLSHPRYSKNFLYYVCLSDIVIIVNDKKIVWSCLGISGIFEWFELSYSGKHITHHAQDAEFNSQSNSRLQARFSTALSWGLNLTAVQFFLSN